MKETQPGNPTMKGGGKNIAPSNQRFKDMLARLKKETDKNTTIHSLKGLLGIKEPTKKEFIQEVLTELCRLLFSKQHYCEVLYYLMAAFYYCKDILQAAGVTGNETLKNESFRIYNDRMLYGLVYTTLNSITPL